MPKKEDSRCRRSRGNSIMWNMIPIMTIAIKILIGITFLPTIFAEDYYISNDDGNNAAGGNTDDGNVVEYYNEAADENTNEEGYYVEASVDDDDDTSQIETESDFEGSIMPLACLKYNDGFMIKYQIYESNFNFQCHANAIDTYVVTISNYMRHYFNYQSATQGSDFALPYDAGYLNCVKLEQTGWDGETVYARIGCLERDGYISTKLSIHTYTDKRCTQPFNDGQSEEERSINGVHFDDGYFENEVSFRPPFYQCDTCQPTTIAEEFSKQTSVWFDDDANAQQRYFDDWVDDYVQNDDAYAAIQAYINNDRQYTKDDDDYFYTRPYTDDVVSDDDLIDDSVRRRRLSPKKRLTPARDDFKKFGLEIREDQRQLYKVYGADDDSVWNYNICNKINQYSVWCDADCQSRVNFFIFMDEWPYSSLFVLFGLCAFLAVNMVFILVNRIRFFQKAAIYEDDLNAPDLGFPPRTLGFLFLFLLGSIATLAVLRLVNETLLVAAVGSVALCCYFVKITWFEKKALSGFEGDRLTPLGSYT